MDLEQIKRDIVNENPIALFQYVDLSSGVVYMATGKNGYVLFIIPIKKMGNTRFLSEMKARDLMKWFYGAGIYLDNKK